MGFRRTGTLVPIVIVLLILSPRAHLPLAGQAGTSSAGQAATAAAFPPLSTMAQLMRSIYFTNSNLIFTVQTRDPGAPPAPAASDSSPSGSGFSFVDWGAGIYTGWQLVDNAALALADASSLLIAPGRLCENGRPVPVDDPEWIAYTREMYDAARLVYEAAKSRSQEAVSEATGPLADACSNCHRTYRDRGGRGGPPAGGATNPNRCVAQAR